MSSAGAAERTIDLVSVHVPKCAGTSLLSVLRGLFGTSSVYEDYGDRPLDPASPMNADRASFCARMAQSNFDFLSDRRAVHGHFHPAKYSRLKRRATITFLRDPIERLISHYFFWRHLPRHGHSLHDHFLDNHLDVEQFAMIPSIRTVYTSVFFGDFDMKQFDFIGFHDRFFEDCQALGELFGVEPAQVEINVNSRPEYRESREAVLADPVQRSRLRDLLREDLAFYDELRGRV